MTTTSRDEQWRSAFVRRRILLRASFNQVSHKSLVTIPCRDVNWLNTLVMLCCAQQLLNSLLALLSPSALVERFDTEPYSDFSAK